MRKSAFLAACLALTPAVAPAHGPSRQKVVETVTVNAPAARVWDIIKDFCSISTWHPGIAKCEGEGGNATGARRVLRLGAPDGPTIREELMQHDDAQMLYKYKIIEVDVKVLPVSTYSATIAVRDNGDGGSTVEWKGGFYRGYPNNNPPPELSDEAAVRAVTGVYTAGLAKIKELAEK